MQTTKPRRQVQNLHRKGTPQIVWDHIIISWVKKHPANTGIYLIKNPKV